jgi:hypothetical protein
MEFQLNLEKLKIEKGQTPSKVSDSNAKYKGPKVPKFEEGQDIDSYSRMHRHFEIVFPQLLKIIKFYQRDRNVSKTN